MGKRYNEKGEELETRREVFMRNYKNVPGFKALVKLGLYLFFILILVILVAITNYTKKENKNNNAATAQAASTTISSLTYGEMIDNISKIGTENKITIKYQNNEYMITSTIKGNYIDGYYETDTTNVKYKIVDSDVYEIKMNNEIKNDSLFEFFDVDFIDNNKLISILKNSVSTKKIDNENIIYNYDISKDDMDSYSMSVIVNNEKIKEISIKNDIIEYTIIPG